jgi:hypothetical protein
MHETDRFAEALIGRTAEYIELLDVLSMRPGVTVVSADPWSGTSAMLSAVMEEVGDARAVDARDCGGTHDLATAIAGVAIAAFAPSARAWWADRAPPGARAGLGVARIARRDGIDLEVLRTGEGAGERRLREAIDLFVAVGDSAEILAIDHLGLAVVTLPRAEARSVLAELRAARQRHPDLDIVLVDHAEGPVTVALGDETHPLYRAGQRIDIRRAPPEVFVYDLTSSPTPAPLDAPAELVAVAADLAAGVPSLTWRAVELAPPEGDDPAARALAGWRRLRRATATQTAREWDLLRRVHPLAQPVAAALARGSRPHSLAANPKTINDALGRLRDVGMAWRPQPRRWALADPLLAAWLRDRPSALGRRVHA